jgi:hypothetical protein
VRILHLFLFLSSLLVGGAKNGPLISQPHSYPAKIREHHHRTLTYLPTEIALALEDSPELIAEAVKAFYEREPDTLKVCSFFTPLFNLLLLIPSSNRLATP